MTPEELETRLAGRPRTGATVAALSTPIGTGDRPPQEEGRMRLSYHTLLNKRVVAADGRCLGRIRDLVTERRGAAPAVTHLVVGMTGLRQRLGLERVPRSRRARQQTVPWELVARIAEEAVYLRVDSAAIQTGDGDGPRVRTSGEPPRAPQRARP